MTVPLFTSRPVPSLLRRAVLAGSLFLPALGLACASSSPPAAPASAAPTPEAAPSTLRPGVPVEREIGGGETHGYPLVLAAGQFLQLRIHQPGVDVAAKLISATGEELTASDIPRGRLEPERLSLLSAGAGEVRLVVSPSSSDSAPGRYRIEMELRAAEPGDTERVAADRSFADGLLLVQDGEEPTRKSLARFQEALSLWEAAGDLHGQVDALVRIGYAQMDLNRDEDANRSCERALTLARQAGYRRGEALALKALGDIHESRDKAVDLYKEAAALWEELGEGGNQGSALYAIGAALYQRPSEALPFLQEALPLRQAAGDVSGEANVLNVIGVIETNQGKLAEALEHLNRALQLSRSVKDLGVQAVALHSLGYIYRLRGDLDEALSSFTRSRELNQEIGDKENELSALSALGSIYLNLGETDRALTYYEEVRNLARSREDWEHQVRALNHLGWTHFILGDYDTALERCKEARTLSESIEEPRLQAQTLHYLGVIETARTGPEQGLSWLLKALEMRQEGLPSDRTLSLLEIGTAYQALKRFEEADGSFRQACDLASSLHNATYESTCLYRWALLDRERGALESALEKIKRSISIVESVRSGVASDKLRTSFFASKRGYYELYVDLLMRLGREEEAFEASEGARARGLMDLLAEGRIDVRQGIAPDLKEREVDLQARLTWLGQTAAASRDPVRTADLRRQIAEVEGEMERLEVETRQLHPLYAEVRYPKPLGAADAQRLLGDRTALLQYFISEDKSYLFVLTSDGLASHELPPAGEIVGRVKKLRQLLEKPGTLTLSRYREEAHSLYETLLGPAAETLRRKPRLLVSPDGVLHLLPFEALLTRKQGSTWSHLPYLLRDHVVSYIPSASVLSGLRAAPPAAPSARAKQLLAFADPIYDGEPQVASSRDAGPRGTALLGRLPESGREARAIARLFRDNEVAIYLRESATETNVKENPYLESARRIHFATHGMLDGAHPQLSGLVLTRDGQSKEDGYLRVLEIFNLKLSADLVVLSACETGLGQEVRSEGIIGLTRAFLYAGARSLLVSLWKAADISTPDLMESFYRHLGNSEARAESLRDSKLEMIEDETYAHPYFWAPFVLSGDPGGPGSL